MDKNQIKTNSNDLRDWKQEINDLCGRLIKDLKLPEDSLYLAENKGKGSNSNITISYSVCFYEPEYPEIKGSAKDQTRNTVIMNIKESELKTKSNRFDVLVRASSSEFVGLIEGMVDKGIQPGTYFKKFQFDKSDVNSIMDNWLEYLERLIKYEFRIYESKAQRFACCSRFTECSDAKECVHENKLYACACSYKFHLDAGEIFYGKNRNI